MKVCSTVRMDHLREEGRDRMVSAMAEVLYPLVFVKSISK